MCSFWVCRCVLCVMCCVLRCACHVVASTGTGAAVCVKKFGCARNVPPLFKHTRRNAPAAPRTRSHARRGAGDAVVRIGAGEQRRHAEESKGVPSTQKEKCFYSSRVFGAVYNSMAAWQHESMKADSMAAWQHDSSDKVAACVAVPLDDDRTEVPEVFDKLDGVRFLLAHVLLEWLLGRRRCGKANLDKFGERERRIPCV